MDKSNAIGDRIRRFILNHFPLARGRSIMDGESLLDTGIIDSLGVLELVNFIEKEFKITISDEELLPENFRSVRSLATFVEQRIGKD